MIELDIINKDPHLFASKHYPLLTIYDDNLFLRNDYDLLTTGQRRYVIAFAASFGFKQTRGTELSSATGKIFLPKPASSLGCSVFKEAYLTPSQNEWHCITATGFAETIFYDLPNIGFDEGMARLKGLIDKCPFNIEWLRDISYGSPIEHSTAHCFGELMAYQKQVIQDQFKHKKTIK